MPFTLFNKHDYAGAREAIEDSIEQLAAARDEHPGYYVNGELGISFAKRAMIAMQADQLGSAITDLKTALELTRKGDNWFYEMTTLLHCAELARLQNDAGQILTTIHAALGLIYEHDAATAQTRRLAECHFTLAHGYLKAGNQDRAHQHYSKARELAQDMSADARHLLDKKCDVTVLQEQLD